VIREAAAKAKDMSTSTLDDRDNVDQRAGRYMAFHHTVAIRRRAPPEMIMVADKGLVLQHPVSIHDYFIDHAFKSDVVYKGIASKFRALDRATGSLMGDFLGEVALVAC
jgi:hypothetical protein